jgi:hypothetical protein
MPTCQQVTCRPDTSVTPANSFLCCVTNMFANMLATCWPDKHMSVILTPDLTCRHPTIPAKHLRAAHISIVFLATATEAETEPQDNDNRSIGWNYCIGTAAYGPYVAVLWALSHATTLSSSMRHAHRSENNSNKYLFSSFNNVDLLCSMSADCCMPWRREWGTMAAVGGRRPPWLACVCILPSFC